MYIQCQWHCKGKGEQFNPMYKYTPDNITELPDNYIFVFGSNTAGVHGAGAALHATHFGAKLRVGEGITGQCYAFPTLNTDFSYGDLRLRKRSYEELLESALKLFKCAQEHPNLTFLLTKVGCGLAGYEEEYMKLFFAESPSNVVKPERW